jgi:hypothetical protein
MNVPPHALARLEFICEKVIFKFHICLYVFVSKSLEFTVYIDQYYVFYYLYKKYDNCISMDLSHLKRSLYKIEGIDFFL